MSYPSHLQSEIGIIMNNPTGDGTAPTWGYRVPKMGHEML